MSEGESKGRGKGGMMRGREERRKEEKWERGRVEKRRKEANRDGMGDAWI